MINPHLPSRDGFVLRSEYDTLGRSADVSGFLASLSSPGWMSAAVCASADAELFYPGHGGTARPAKQVCAGCPVRVECLEYALDRREPFGVWGGLSERERRRLRRGVA